MPLERAAVAVDAGGTYLKGGVIGRDGVALAGSPCSVPVDSGGAGEGILDAFATVVSRELAAAAEAGVAAAGIGIAFPGPFDFAGGRSLMRHKFTGIHGVELRPELRRRCGLPEDLPIRFLHDVHAFLRGEIFRGAAKGFPRVAGVTIGTGLGFGCFLDGRFLDNGAGSPHLGLYKMPYGASILEDAVSRRGIVADYRRRSGVLEDPDVAEIAVRARDRRDAHALETFRGTGRALAECLEAELNGHRIQCLILGGQISKSFDLFREELEALTRKVPTLRAVRQAQDIDGAPLFGAAGLILEA